MPKPEGLLAENVGWASDIADIAIIGPNRERATISQAFGGLHSRAVINRDSAAQAAVSSYEVRWANHTSNNSLGASLAGDNYVAVSLASDAELLLPIPITIAVDVVGEVAGVPEYLDPAATPTEDPTTATPTEATTEPAPAQTPEPSAVPEAEDADDGASRLGLILGAVGLVAVLAVVAVVMLRRRRASAGGPS